MSWSHYHGDMLVEHPDVSSCTFPGATDFPPDPTPPNDEWYISISTRAASTSGADRLYWRFLEIAKEIRPANLGYVSVTCSKVGEDEGEEPTEYHDENTLVKVRAALFEAFGKYEPTREEIFDAVNLLQSYGILFRERR